MASSFKMPELNTLVIAGRIATDITTRTFDSTQNTLAEFTLCSSKFLGKSGDKRKEDTAWLRVKAWGRVAENVINQGMKKGDPILVEGRVTTEEWNKDGQKQARTVVRARAINALSWPDRPHSQPPQEHEEEELPPISEDDIPF